MKEPLEVAASHRLCRRGLTDLGDIFDERRHPSAFGRPVGNADFGLEDGAVLPPVLRVEAPRSSRHDSLDVGGHRGLGALRHQVENTHGQQFRFAEAAHLAVRLVDIQQAALEVAQPVALHRGLQDGSVPGFALPQRLRRDVAVVQGEHQAEQEEADQRSSRQRQPDVAKTGRRRQTTEFLEAQRPLVPGEIDGNQSRRQPYARSGRWGLALFAIEESGVGRGSVAVEDLQGDSQT